MKRECFLLDTSLVGFETKARVAPFGDEKKKTKKLFREFRFCVNFLCVSEG